MPRSSDKYMAKAVDLVRASRQPVADWRSQFPPLTCVPVANWRSQMVNSGFDARQAYDAEPQLHGRGLKVLQNLRKRFQIAQSMDVPAKVGAPALAPAG